MKNRILLFLFAMAAVSCSKDDNNNTPVNVCAIPVPVAQSTVSVTNSCAIAVSSSGMIAVSAYNGGYGVTADIKIYTSLANFKNGTVKSTLQATAPEAMAFDNDNNLYVSETEQVAGIKVFDHIGDGAFAYKKTIQDDFNNPRGIAFDAQGRLFLADDGTGRIIRFDDPFNSNNHATIGNWDVGIKGLAIRGNVMYVTNYNTDTVSRNILKTDGTLDTLTDGITFEGATDVSFRGNRVIITSYDGATLGVCSDCDFSDANKKVYTNLAAAYGTAFASDSVVLAATYGTDNVTIYNLF